MDNYIDNIIKKYKIVSQKQLLKGWSWDRKYILEDESGKKYLLRLTDKEFYYVRLEQYKVLNEVSKLDINTTKAIDFGRLQDGTAYMLTSYLEGKEGLEVIPKLGDKESYNLGVESGKILKILHEIPIKNDNKSWWEKYQIKMLRKIYKIENCGMVIPMQKEIIKYYEENVFLMKERPQRFSHGDYHLGNMIINDYKIGIIDFEKSTVADPYDDFKPYRWNVLANEFFQTGLINGYFDNNIPKDFWPVIKFYTAESMLSQLPWAQKFGKEEIDTAFMLVDKQLEWYDNFSLDIPKWYKNSEEISRIIDE